METKEIAKTEKATQFIQLVKGGFTPSEASHIINSLIDENTKTSNLGREPQM